MKRAEECDRMLALGVIPRQLQRALNRLRSRISVVETVGPGHRRNLRQPLRQLHHALVVEIRSRHVDQFARLLLNGGDHIRMAMASRSHSNAGGKIKKLVAVHVSDDDAASALGDHRVRTRVRRRNILLIALEHALGVGPGQGGLNLGTDRSGHSVSSHGSSSIR